MKGYWNYISFSIIIIANVILTSCSHTEGPTNLEPHIIIGEASDITRTSSVISAKIETPGPTTLSYLRFYYGEKDKITNHTADISVNSTEIKVEIQNLKPGTEYFYYAEGGTSTATLRSETMSFTTIPNNKPTVTEAIPLSTGPTGIIVEFDIVDDGGENLTEGGCIVTEISTNHSSRILIPADKLNIGVHQLYITGLQTNTAYNITSFASNTMGESDSEPLQYTTKDGVILHEAGLLRSLLGDDVPLTILSISGELNGTDFKFLRQLTGAPVLPGEPQIHSNVTDLNLADAHIVEGGEAYDDYRYTQNDILTAGIFLDCVKLKNIILPNSLKAIKRDAFSGCISLEILSIPMNVSEIMPSDNCSGLREIQVSQANANYAAVDGVLFNKAITEILWFPLGKTGYYILPSSIISIGENAFMGTHITSLEIPSSVKEIHRGAFYGSDLQEIILPDNLTNISEGLFQNCNKLQTLRLGSGTEYIGNYAFDGTSLKNLYVAATIPPYVTTNAFVNNSYSLFENCTLHVPKGYRNNYRNHAKWKQFSNIVEF